MIAVNGGPGLSHAYMVVNDLWQQVAAHRLVVLYDQRGTGGSKRLALGASQSIDAQVADLDAIRAHLGLEKVTLVGDSYGGLLSMAYAAAHPEHMAKLVLSDSPGPSWNSIVHLLPQVFPDVEEQEAAEQTKLAGNPEAAAQASLLSHFRMIFYSPEKRDQYLAHCGDLAVADWVNRTNKAGGVGGEKLAGGKIFTVRDVLEYMVKAHEIQGVMALENSFNKVGLDHVLLVKVASTSVVANMLGLSEAQTRDAISQAWVDGQSMRTYRHSPNTMSRKSWAAGDACQKAVNLCLKVLGGEGGMPTVLTAPTWGFYDVNFHGAKFSFQREYGSYVMENVLFKVSYPAEFHSQTAIEAAQRINKKLAAMGKSAEDIEDVTNRTHEACIRIIDKQFKPMSNYADRDHCVQYMVAVMFAFNRLEAGDYTDSRGGGAKPACGVIEATHQVCGGPAVHEGLP